MTSVSSTSCLTIPSDVIWRDVDGETVLLNVATGNYFGLDGVASRIWQLIGEGTTFGALCDQLAGDYDVDRATVDADVSGLVQDLVSHQLVSLDA